MPPLGQRNGRLEFLGLVDGDKRKLRVRCDCGAEKVIRFGNWRKTLSCGCLMREVNSAQKATHGWTRGSSIGLKRPPEYTTWANIVKRCTNPNATGWESYGGRGIRVCERWRSFENFLSDMGPRPSPRHSIDRIDVNGDYEPTNCRWATKREQMRNTRRTLRVELDGKLTTVADVAERTGVPRNTVAARLERGWSPEEAANNPVKQRPKLNIEPGNRFGRLTVVESVGRHFKGNHICYRCECDCGAEKIATGTKLVAGVFRYCTQRCPLRKTSS